MLSYPSYAADTTSYACIQPLELCSTGWSKFPLFAAPLPRLNPHWQPSHIRNNPQAVIAIKKTCLSGWKQQSQWIRTTMGSEVNKMLQNVALIFKQRKEIYLDQVQIFFWISAALMLWLKKTLTQFWVLGQHVVFRWLLQINLELVFSVPDSEFLQSCEKR